VKLLEELVRMPPVQVMELIFDLLEGGIRASSVEAMAYR
jgi:hypothetical protein